MSVSRPAVTSRPLARMATRLQSASASLSTCELKKTVQPAIAQPQDQRAHVAAAERIEPGHRLVENHQLGLVDERLRDADALQHAFRELAQLQAALGADADLVEQPRDARAAAPRRR